MPYPCYWMQRKNHACLPIQKGSGAILPQAYCSFQGAFDLFYSFYLSFFLAYLLAKRNTVLQ